MCYKFNKNNNGIYCGKCRLRAKQCTNENGEEYISLGYKQHSADCQPIKYSSIKAPLKIVKAPDFRIQKERFRFKWTKKLVVFTSSDKKFCYQYSRVENQNEFVCYKCRKQKQQHVYAKVIKIDENEEVVQLGEREHCCEPQEYVLEDLTVKIVRKQDFKIENLIVRGKENQYLFVRDLKTTSDKYLWFKYNFDKKEK
uniref:Uncharacterized protein n=1 Tax=Panagrolaimus sp. ES5 TaxID=591445 RepID=A0AC34G7G1_9BILA